MTYFEIEQENKRLKSLLKEATELPSGQLTESWLAATDLVLNPPKTEQGVFVGIGARWEGEECGDKDCKHSSTFHAGGGRGLCTKVDCVCHTFVATGRAVTEAR